jgi:hypothetical protein
MRRAALVLLAVAVGWLWLHRHHDRDRRVPGDSTHWTVWHRDTFDGEDTERTAEADGTGILAGLAHLWDRSAFEGIEDEEGDATFSAFSITWGDSPAESAWVHMKSFDNTALLKIRRWLDEPTAAAIAKAHLRLLEHSDRWTTEHLDPSAETMPILEAAAAASDRADFVKRLAAL